MLDIGTRIVKVNSEPGDGHKDGSKGKILTVIPIPITKAIGISEAVRTAGGCFPAGYIITCAYFIEWDEHPGIPVGTIDYKIQEDK
jgi:hypothetical protein